MLGFAAQALFGGRLLTQWWMSEKRGSVVSPALYWHLSLGGSALFLLYGLIRSDLVIVIGQAVSYYIYIRNLQLKNAWIQFPKGIQLAIFAFPIVLWTAYVTLFGLSFHIQSFKCWTNPIILLGTVGQLALNFRYVYQWHHSEKNGDSVLPIGFWSISTWASVLVIVYALFHPSHRIEPVLLVSQSLGIFVYIRNMILSLKMLKEKM
jgi:lipid-A-disaccharide synthase-like uncharacterized protein